MSYDFDGEMDMISILPDEILHHILSFLPTEDAVRTSILAKRWRYSWIYLSEFHFEIKCGNEKKQNPFENLMENVMKRLLHEENRNTVSDMLERLQDEFENFANPVLNIVERLLDESDYIKRLNMEIFSRDADRLSSVVSSALKNRVEDLHLSMYSSGAYYVLPTPCVLPNSFSASKSLKKLVFEGCVRCFLDIPSDILFPHLETLNFSSVTFLSDEKPIQQFFAGCPVLTDLTFSDCDWSYIQNMRIKLSALRMLHIYDHKCYDPVIISFHRRMEIDAPNLLSFRCQSHMIPKYVVVNLHSIVDAHVDVMNRDADRALTLLSGLYSVQNLTLSNKTLKCLSLEKHKIHLLPLFPNLIRLDVERTHEDFTNEILMDFLHKTPKLKILRIPEGFDPNICLDGGEWILNSVPWCFKSSLELFIISHFKGVAGETHLLRFFFRKATVLKEIQLWCNNTFIEILKKKIEIWKRANISNQSQDRDIKTCAVKVYEIQD